VSHVLELEPMGMDLRAALLSWREQSWQQPEPTATQAARAAMHRAVATVRPQGLAAQLRSVLSARRLTLAVGPALVAAAAVVGVAGWNAPAGSALHDVRLAREHVQLLLAGSGADELRLSFAEDRLRDAASGVDRQGSLDEAAGLLGDARADLGSNPHSALWGRLNADLAALDTARGRGHDGEHQVTPGGSGAAPGGGGGGGGSDGRASTPASGLCGNPDSHRGLHPCGPGASSAGGNGPGDTGAGGSSASPAPDATHVSKGGGNGGDNPSITRRHAD